MKNHNWDLQKLGDRLKKIRIKKGFISVEKFAFDSELSRVLYTNYENGRGNITYKNLLKVTHALGISLKDFFSEGFDWYSPKQITCHHPERTKKTFARKVHPQKRKKGLCLLRHKWNKCWIKCFVIGRNHPDTVHWTDR